MANNTYLVEERSRDLGSFLVGRLLPFKEKRLVGPFCFIDHMGPATFGDGNYFDVNQHPHIGLCTLTYLIEGEMMHRDSTGAVQKVTPGAVNLMVAGSGVSHTERTPDDLRVSGAVQTLHGYQVWIALPKAQEEIEPAFFHIESTALPHWEQGELFFTLIAGKGFGYEAPTPTFSPLFMVDVKSLAESSVLNIGGELEGEIAIVVVKGTVSTENNTIEAGQMLISKAENECFLNIAADSQVLLFGGKPLEEERYMYWNFVSHSKERLEQAKSDWRNRLFPKVPNDDTYIPLP